MAHDVRIHPVLNGFVCEVGCQTVVFTSLDTLCKMLRKYYTNPKAMENIYLEHVPSWISRPEPVGCTEAVPTRAHMPEPPSLHDIGGSVGRS
jgi:hypothetical protein